MGRQEWPFRPEESKTEKPARVQGVRAVWIGRNLPLRAENERPPFVPLVERGAQNKWASLLERSP